jgi:hypothetical protein
MQKEVLTTGKKRDRDILITELTLEKSNTKKKMYV